MPGEVKAGSSRLAGYPASMTEQAFRFELAPNKRQVTLLAQAVGTRRFAYNWGLARIEQHYRQTGRFLTAIDLHTELCALKKSDFAWMYEVSKCAPQEALRDLEKAYKRFFKGESRRPRFKKKGRCVDSFRVYDDKKRSFAVEPRAITIPRVGRVRTKEQTSKLLAALTQNGDIVSATLTREPDGKWFVSLLARREREFWEQKQDPSCEGRVVGIDLGISTLLTCHSGASYLETGPGHRLEDELRRLKRLGRELSRRQQGSKGYGRTQARLARSHARVRRRRRDFTHKLTTQLAKTTSVIVIEDLAVKNLLANKRLARRISDAGWGEIVRQLEYKAAWYGATVIQADRYYPSSKTCSDCGWVGELLAWTQGARLRLQGVRPAHRS